MKKKHNIILIALIGFMLSCANAQKPNVLFIAVDDLRPELGCYGADQVKSPNIDKLASQSLVFNKTYCNVPVCGASRASLLTGVRPNYTRFVGFAAWADKDLPGNLSLPRHFKENGYKTYSYGKIYHQEQDDLAAWTETPWHPKTDGVTRDYILNESKKIIEANQANGPAFEAAQGHDTIYTDGKTTVQALAKMEELKNSEEPFFLAVGYYKPHLPFNAPKKYWDLYTRSEIKLADNPYIPKDAPTAGYHNSAELRKQYSGVPETRVLPDDYARTLKHGYYACVSYTDAQIGMLLNKLEELGLSENTIVVLWGDHGWNLGEHTLWCKHSLFKTSLNAPLMIKIPGKTKGAHTNAITEFVDIYPTVAEVCGLNIPEHCEGKPLTPLVENPNATLKQATYSKWHKGICMRTERYQYSEWIDPKTKAVQAQMLYDHETDPNENVNIATLPENAELVKQLQEQLHSWWYTYLEEDAKRYPKKE